MSTHMYHFVYYNNDIKTYNNNRPVKKSDNFNIEINLPTICLTSKFFCTENITKMKK